VCVCVCVFVCEAGATSAVASAEIVMSYRVVRIAKVNKSSLACRLLKAWPAISICVCLCLYLGMGCASFRLPEY